MSYDLLESVTAYAFNAEKDAWLKKHRGIGFEEIIGFIEGGRLLDIRPHPNREKYPSQYMAEIDVHDYIVTVPFVSDVDDTIWFLKTAYFNRKSTRKIKRGHSEENH